MDPHQISFRVLLRDSPPMIRCYLLALCSGSSLSQHTNNFTLFNLVDQLNLPAPLLGTAILLEVHFYWVADPGTTNQEYELRLLRTNSNGDVDPGDSIAFQFVESGSRQRVVTRALRLPKTFGLHMLRVQWRSKGEEQWHDDPACWPLQVVELQESGELDPSEGHH